MESKDELLEKEDTTEITVIVKTGKLVHAGTDADVCITVIGQCIFETFDLTHSRRVLLGFIIDDFYPVQMLPLSI